MISVVTWLWHVPGYRSDFTAARVNGLYRAVAKHYPFAFKPVCVTDIPEGLAPDIHVVPLWPDYRDLSVRRDSSHPGCYHRLKAFAPEMKDLLGPRFVSIDLDCVIVGDLTPIFNREEDFVIWQPRDAPEKRRWNGSLWMMDAGAREHVWRGFRGASSAKRAVDAGYYAADQGIIQFALRRNVEATWTPADGVLDLRTLIKEGGQLPPHARIVFSPGKFDPWSPEALDAAPWIQEHLFV